MKGGVMWKHRWKVKILSIFLSGAILRQAVRCSKDCGVIYTEITQLPINTIPDLLGILFGRKRVTSAASTNNMNEVHARAHMGVHSCNRKH